ncbi:Transmembrane and immunoglobulin domain-containing protein 1 [Portunus trituberculatus]|uniref:Transmembrane and immunoglobulin domain-containing protein 1 n=1 Tax=Portunus trituberculatus TaxID=210409 RepID=A0A5B7F820_PORTR|nr:Transmembrane and immunoglobulin domain-containing protein 1 [Portunus trituberculatus]
MSQTVCDTASLKRSDNINTHTHTHLILSRPPNTDLPVCVDGPQSVVVAEGEDVRLTCRVDAKPEDDLRFTWYFNNTLDTVEVERHRVQVRPGLSYLDYTPRSSRDYGSLACWATNTVGTQADPCQFTVLEAGQHLTLSQVGKSKRKGMGCGGQQCMGLHCFHVHHSY